MASALIDLTQDGPLTRPRQGRPRPRVEPEEIDLCSSSDDEPTGPQRKRQRAGEAAKEEAAACPICLEEKIEPVFVHRLAACKHAFCLGCLRGYVSSKVADRAFPITCPLLDCAAAMGVPECSLVLMPEEQEVLGKLEAESAIPAAHRLFCPNPACSQLLLVEGEAPQDAEMACPYCSKPLCPHCRVLWHAGLTCKQYEELPAHLRGEEDQAMLALAGQKKWRQCPRCRNMVERSSGCNAMRCRCGNAFCYECGQQLRQCHCAATRGHVPLHQAAGEGGVAWWAGPPPPGAGAPEGWMGGLRRNFGLGVVQNFFTWLLTPEPPHRRIVTGMRAPRPHPAARFAERRNQREGRGGPRAGDAAAAVPARDPAAAARAAAEQEAARVARQARREQQRAAAAAAAAAAATADWAEGSGAAASGAAAAAAAAGPSEGSAGAEAPRSGRARDLLSRMQARRPRQQGRASRLHYGPAVGAAVHGEGSGAGAAAAHPATPGALPPPGGVAAEARPPARRPTSAAAAAGEAPAAEAVGEGVADKEEEAVLFGEDEGWGGDRQPRCRRRVGPHGGRRAGWRGRRAAEWWEELEGEAGEELGL